MRRRASGAGSRAAVISACLLAAAGLAACDVSFGGLAGKATDEWTRSYQLAPGGEVRIGNTNGKIEIEPSDGSTVEVRAERIAHAATDEGARELLPRITIKEDVKPDRIAIETERLSGFMVGASVEVRYHVRAPKTAVVRATNTNGAVTVTGFSGKVVAETTNGAVAAHDLSGGVEARTTNGSVNVDLASVGPDSIDLRTTNGGLVLTLPGTAKADLSASCVNGGIDVSGINLDGERSRRHVEGKMNGGGTHVGLHTTNGGIRVRARSGA
jgi:RNase P/RNase MRP subunit p29